MAFEKVEGFRGGVQGNILSRRVRKIQSMFEGIKGRSEEDADRWAAAAACPITLMIVGALPKLSAGGAGGVSASGLPFPRPPRGRH